jgi:Domain of unknown function (DUF4190)/Protein of unknown function (DUF2510)
LANHCIAADCTDSVLGVNDRPDRSTDEATAGWFPDPLHRYDHRWYNGTSWTADVSIDGRRFVDPVPLDAVTPATHSALYGSGMPPQGAWQSPGVPAAGWSPAARPPSRTLAVLALIAGLVAVGTGWMPLLFVIGAIAGVAAIALAVIARGQIREGRARGAGMALAGLILGPIGLASCVVGVMLTGMLLREVRDYTEPGPVDVEITSCVAEGRTVRVNGTLENLDDETRDYSLVVEVVDGDGGQVVERDSVEILEVVAGELREWERLVLTRADTPQSPECNIFAVNGPFPFGLDPNP